MRLQHGQSIGRAVPGELHVHPCSTGSQPPIRHSLSAMPPCRCHHPPHTCALSAAWGRPCGCSSRPWGGLCPRQKPPTAGCRRCPPPEPGRAAAGAADSPPPPCAPARPAPPVPHPGSAARPDKVAAGGSGHLWKRWGMQRAWQGQESPGVNGGAEPQLTAHLTSAQPTSQLCSPDLQRCPWRCSQVRYTCSDLHG